MQVSRWGNSLAIRLPAAVVEALGLQEGDDVKVIASNRTLIEIERQPGVDAVLERLRTLRGRLPADFRFDREGANER